VPGHGPVRVGEEIGVVLDGLDEYAAFVAEVARDGHAAGRSPLETATAARGNRFAGWQETERLVGNLYRAYSELAGNPLDAPIRLDAVWVDMVAFNGGPIGCFA
jgi:cyclase